MRASGPVERDVRRAHVAKFMAEPTRERILSRPVHNALRGDLAPRRPVEDDPHSEVLTEVLEPVLCSSGYEDEVSGFESISAAIVKEDSPAAGDDVDLVLCMRCLAVWGNRQGKQRPDRATLHDSDEVRARRARDALLGFCKRDHAAAI